MKKFNVLFILSVSLIGLFACSKTEKKQQPFPELDLQTYSRNTLKYHQQASQYLKETYDTSKVLEPADFRKTELTIQKASLKSTNCDELLNQILYLHTYWIYEYEWLITHIQKLGYKFGDFEDFKRNKAESGKLYLRYDIHIRDIAALYGILGVNQKNSIRAEAFLLWGFTKLEEENRPLFSKIKQCSYPGLRFGLHVEALSGVLENDLDPDQQPVEKWITKGGVQKLFDAILKQGNPEQKIDEYKNRAIQLHKQFQLSFEKEFPASLMESVHGSILSREINRLNELDKKYHLFEALVANNVTRAFPYGKESDQHILIDDVKAIKLTDTNTENDLLCKLERVSKKHPPVVLLLHPAQFFRQTKIYSKWIANPGDAIDPEHCKKTNFDELEEPISKDAQ